MRCRLRRVRVASEIGDDVCFRGARRALFLRNDLAHVPFRFAEDSFSGVPQKKSRVALSQRLDPAEAELERPVRALFEPSCFQTFTEVPLGRKRIDLLFVPHHGLGQWVAVELKVSQWKRALWQAHINRQLVDLSYIAVWTRIVPVVLANADLLRQYNIGLIEVDRDVAKVIIPAGQRLSGIPTDTRSAVLERIDRGKKQNAANSTPRLLSA